VAFRPLENRCWTALRSAACLTTNQV